MDFRRGLLRVSPLDVKALVGEAENAGWQTFVLSDDGVIDKDSFFEAVRRSLPLDPPAYTSWDALEDSLWQGLYDHAARRIVILWPNAGRMASAAPKDFETAVSIFSYVSELLADSKATLGRTKDVAILVE